MPLASLVGVDAAGGPILGGGQSSVTVGGVPLVVVGDAVTPHGLTPHDAATMAQGSAAVTINGVAVCRAGDLATCGDPATGSSHVEVSA